VDLFREIKTGDEGSVSRILQSGIDINEQDHNGMTPLMVAVDVQRKEMVELILRGKPKIDMTDRYGQTALMLAAGRNFIPAIRLILAAKPNLKLLSKSGLTALGFAQDNGNREAAELLRKAGAR